MIYTHFVGRIGSDAKTLTGNNGMYISMDVAVDNFIKGEKVTTWIRVRSDRSNHINLAKYLTKGRLILCQGTLNDPTIYTSKKDGQEHVQLGLRADSIDFVSIGKKKDGEAPVVQAQPVTPEPTENKSTTDDPLGAPADTTDDLPF